MDFNENVMTHDASHADAPTSRAGPIAAASTTSIARAMSRVREGEIEIPSAKHKEFTLVMIRDYAEDKILLGEKLRGFGSGCVR